MPNMEAKDKFVMDDILYYCSITLAVWIIGWYIIYLVSGFHMKSVSMNNGILFNGISYTNRKVSMTLGTFRFRLWGDTRKLVMDDLVIKLHSREGAPSKSRKVEKEDEPLNGAIDLTIFPSNWVARTVVRFVIRHIPKFDVGLKHTTVVYLDATTTTTIEYLRFMLVSRYSKKSVGDLKVYATLVANEVVNSSQSDNLKLVPPMSLQTLKLQLNLLIGVLSGSIHNVKIRLFTDEFKCIIFRTAKLFIDRIKEEMEFNGINSATGTKSPQESNLEHEQQEEKPTEQEDVDTSKLQSKFDKILKIRNKLYPVIKEISFSLDNSELLEIPFAITDAKMSFNDYFDYSAGGDVH